MAAAERSKIYYIAGYVVSSLIVKHIMHAKKIATTNRPYPGNVNWQFVHCLEVLRLGARDRGGLPAQVATYMAAIDRGGLTWVTAAFFDLMVDIEQHVRTHLNRFNVQSGMVGALKDALLGSVGSSFVLRERFVTIVNEGLAARQQGGEGDLGSAAAAASLAYVSMVGMYIKVRLREFRRHIERNKSEHRRLDSLRRQLKNAVMSKKQALKFVISHESVSALGGVEGMHVALVGFLWTHGSSIIEHMTVEQLKVLCCAYGHKPKSSARKADLLKAAYDGILAVDAAATVTANKPHIDKLCGLTVHKGASNRVVVQQQNVPAAAAAAGAPS